MSNAETATVQICIVEIGELWLARAVVDAETRIIKTLTATPPLSLPPASQKLSS